LCDRKFRLLNQVSGQATCKEYSFDCPLMTSIQYLNATAPSLLNGDNLYMVRIVSAIGATGFHLERQTNTTYWLHSKTLRGQDRNSLDYLFICCAKHSSGSAPNCPPARRKNNLVYLSPPAYAIRSRC